MDGLLQDKLAWKEKKEVLIAKLVDRVSYRRQGIRTGRESKG
jgi:hypothetical protein